MMLSMLEDFGGCDADLNSFNPTIAAGTLMSNVCMAACNTCEPAATACEDDADWSEATHADWNCAT